MQRTALKPNLDPLPQESIRAGAAHPLLARLADLADLAKPRITLLVVITAAVGMALAPAPPGLLAAVPFLLATACLVAAANTLNCWIEREIDGRMQRTRSRPLPAGRLAPAVALGSGLVLGAAALALLFQSSNPLTFALGTIALLSYVLVYTPLKRSSPWAVVVGAVPGAIPPLMGWTAATGTLAAPGWFLFAILFLWQLPHFVAISLRHEDDYRRAGLLVLPVVHGTVVARRHLFASTVLLVACSLAGLGLAGPLYLSVAAVLGLVFLYLAAQGLRREVPLAWSGRTFAYSLIYLPLLIGVFVLDAR